MIYLLIKFLYEHVKIAEQKIDITVVDIKMQNLMNQNQKQFD